MKYSFDIGGVITRYPREMKAMMHSLRASGNEVIVITDMPADRGRQLLDLNGFDFPVYGADWTKHEERCKSVLLDELAVDVHFDDHAPYCAAAKVIGCFLWPRPDLPYKSPGWIEVSA